MTTLALVFLVLLLLAGGLFLLEVAFATALVAARLTVGALILIVGLVSFLAVLPFRPRLALRRLPEGFGGPAHEERFA